MKRCKDCGIEKALSEFYRHSEMADGYLNSCKVCRRRYLANRPKERLATIERKRNKKQKRKDHFTRNTKQWRAKHPDGVKAHRIVRGALRTGKLKKQPCEVCGETQNIHAHHEDYLRPLDVNWLCPKHHSKRDKKLKGNHNDQTRA